MIVARPANRTLPLALLGAAGFLSSAGSRVIDSLLEPVAQTFDRDIPEIAWVLAAFAVPYGVLQLVLGPVADRVGKARVLRAALACYALATLGCALAPNFAALVLFRILAGASSAGLIPVCLAYIGDTTDYGTRQVTLSRFLGGVVLAQIVAGPIGGVFGQYLSWRGVFVLLAAAAALLCCVLWRMPMVAPRPTGVSTPSPWRHGRLLRGRNRVFFLLTFIDGAVFIGVAPFVAPYLHETLGRSYAQTGLVLACFGIGTLLYVRTARRMLPRLGERGMVLAGCVLGAAGMAMAAAAGSWVACVPAEILFGLGYFMLHGVLQARATELLPDARGTATSCFAFALFVGQAAGALACAQAIGSWGYPPIFLAAASGMLALGLAAALYCGAGQAAGGAGLVTKSSRQRP